MHFDDFGLYTTRTTDFWPRQLVTNVLRGNWWNGFWFWPYVK